MGFVIDDVGALVEGLAGVQSGYPGFDTTWLEPHWDAAGVDHAEVKLAYAASGKEFHYTYTEKDNVTELSVKTYPIESLRIGLHDNLQSIKADLSGKPVDVKIISIHGRRFAFFQNVEAELRLIIRELRHSHDLLVIFLNGFYFYIRIFPPRVQRIKIDFRRRHRHDQHDALLYRGCANMDFVFLGASARRGVYY